MLIDLGVVDLVCDLISFEQKLAIKEEALLVCVAILLGGNYESQIQFKEYITRDKQNAFMRSLYDLINLSFEQIKKTQHKRNNLKQKLIQIESSIQNIQLMKNELG